MKLYCTILIRLAYFTRCLAASLMDKFYIVPNRVVIITSKKNAPSKGNTKAKILVKSNLRQISIKADLVAKLFKAHPVALRVIEKLRKILDSVILKEDKIAARLNVVITKAEARAHKSITKANKFLS